MANTFITPSVIASRALATLYNTIVLAGLVHRDYDADFNGKVGDTVTIRKPATFTVDEYSRGSGLDIQNATETSTTVVLDKLLDVSVAVTSEDLTLELNSFDEQILSPAMEAIAQDVDGRLAEALVDQATTDSQSADGTTSQNLAFREARAVLGRAKLPLTNRSAVLSPEAVSDVLGDDLFVTANQSGSTDGLREASIGRAFGFETYESQVFGYGADDKGQADGVAFHRDSVALVSRALALPMDSDATKASVQNYKGLALRVVKDYDIDQKQDVVSCDVLIGVKAGLRSDAAVELDFGQGS